MLGLMKEHPLIDTAELRGTLVVELPGGLDRMRQLVLYVADRLADAQHFGVIKLNKVLWRADFRSFATCGEPVTGREYRRLEFGPAPREAQQLRRQMVEEGSLRIDKAEAVDGKIEHRPVALRPANLSSFNTQDLRFVDDAIAYYRDMTGTETSDDSHGAAWKSRNNGDPMPYELALLSDRPIGRKQFLRLQSKIEEEGSQSL